VNARELQMLDSRGGADSGMGGGASGAPSGFSNQAPAQPGASSAVAADSAPTLSDDTDFEDDIPF